MHTIYYVLWTCNVGMYLISGALKIINVCWFYLKYIYALAGQVHNKTMIKNKCPHWVHSDE